PDGSTVMGAAKLDNLFDPPRIRTPVAVGKKLSSFAAPMTVLPSGLRAFGVNRFWFAIQPEIGAGKVLSCAARRLGLVRLAGCLIRSPRASPDMPRHWRGSRAADRR